MNKLELVCIAVLVIGSLAANAQAASTTDSTSDSTQLASFEDYTATQGPDNQSSPDGNDATDAPASNATEPVTKAAPPVNPDAEKVSSIIEDLRGHHCNGTDGQPCKFPKATGDDYKALCKVLDDAAECIKHCDVATITETASDERGKMNCDGCGFLQGSLMMLLLAAFLHLLV